MYTLTVTIVITPQVVQKKEIIIQKTTFSILYVPYLTLALLKGPFLFNLEVRTDYSILFTLKNQNHSYRCQLPVLLRVLENAARPRARTYTAEFTYVQNFQNAYKITKPYSKDGQNYQNEICE